MDGNKVSLSPCVPTELTRQGGKSAFLRAIFLTSLPPKWDNLIPIYIGSDGVTIKFRWGVPRSFAHDRLLYGHPRWFDYQLWKLARSVDRSVDLFYIGISTKFRPVFTLKLQHGPRTSVRGECSNLTSSSLSGTLLTCCEDFA